jgi:hypothetical protein
MKKLIFILIIAVILFGCFGSRTQRVYKKAEKIITTVELQKNVNLLASDWMKGRNTPSKELDSAARYIASEFEKYGVQPVNNSYFQEIPFGSLDLGKKNLLKISRGEVERKFKLKDDYIPFEMSRDSVVNAAVVFAGYGISAPELNYDDYANIDAKGKVVVIITHVPKEKKTSTVFGGKNKSIYATIEKKVEIALNHGATGIIVLTDPINHEVRDAVGHTWPSFNKYYGEDSQLEVIKESKCTIPVVHADDDIARFLFKSIDSLKKIQKQIDNYMKPFSYFLDSLEISIKTNVIEKKKPSQNVVGFIEGSDPVLKKEILVIGAHYDHIGYLKKHKAGEDYINNGADDNASGTAGVLAIAKAFGKSKFKPKRSVLFILFAGEEKGLLGSAYYVSNPLFPMENTIAMINLDMISRNSINSLTLEGASKSPDIAKIIKDLNIEYKFNFNIKKEKDAYLGGSDHYNFYLKDIPMIFFFANIHPDYHTVYDNPDKINAEKAAKISKLAFCTAWYITNDTSHYKLIRTKNGLD